MNDNYVVDNSSQLYLDPLLGLARAPYNEGYVRASFSCDVSD
jgi:hypothetical protein